MRNISQIIDNITDTLKNEGVEKIILFGSYAYGVPDEESDIDLLIIKDISTLELRDFRINIKLKLWDTVKKWNIPIDVIVDSSARINQRIIDGDMFYKEILTNGNVIYA